MARLDIIKESLKIPEGVDVEIRGHLVKVKGHKGECSRDFVYPGLKIEKHEDKITFEYEKPTKREKRMVNTFKAHIKNMIKGVNEGISYKLKICSTHFPMSVKVEHGNVVISNFFGEKVPRKAKIVDGVHVKIEGDEIIVDGVDKEKVGLTAGRIEQATRITNKSRIIFQDGCYITHKSK